CGPANALTGLAACCGAVTRVMGGVTVTASGADWLGWAPGKPAAAAVLANRAVIACGPRARVEVVVNAAVPSGPRGTVPRSVVPSEKVTVPAVIGGAARARARPAAD